MIKDIVDIAGDLRKSEVDLDFTARLLIRAYDEDLDHRAAAAMALEKVRDVRDRLEAVASELEKLQVTDEIVVTQAMLLDGIAAARRAGHKPCVAVEDFDRLKSVLISSYRAMRALEPETQPIDELSRRIRYALACARDIRGVARDQEDEQIKGGRRIRRDVDRLIAMLETGSERRDDMA
jgi:hypothetical protein